MKKIFLLSLCTFVLLVPIAFGDCCHPENPLCGLVCVSPEICACDPWGCWCEGPSTTTTTTTTPTTTTTTTTTTTLPSCDDRCKQSYYDGGYCDSIIYTDKCIGIYLWRDYKTTLPGSSCLYTCQCYDEYTCEPGCTQCPGGCIGYNNCASGTTSSTTTTTTTTTTIPCGGIVCNGVCYEEGECCTHDECGDLKLCIDNICECQDDGVTAVECDGNCYRADAGICCTLLGLFETWYGGGDCCTFFDCDGESCIEHVCGGSGAARYTCDSNLGSIPCNSDADCPEDGWCCVIDPENAECSQYIAVNWRCGPTGPTRFCESIPGDPSSCSMLTEISGTIVNTAVCNANCEWTNANNMGCVGVTTQGCLRECESDCGDYEGSPECDELNSAAYMPGFYVGEPLKWCDENCIYNSVTCNSDIECECDPAGYASGEYCCIFGILGGGGEGFRWVYSSYVPDNEVNCIDGHDNDCDGDIDLDDSDCDCAGWFQEYSLPSFPCCTGLTPCDECGECHYGCPNCYCCDSDADCTVCGEFICDLETHSCLEHQCVWDWDCALIGFDCADYGYPGRRPQCDENYMCYCDPCGYGEGANAECEEGYCCTGESPQGPEILPGQCVAVGSVEDYAWLCD